MPSNDDGIMIILSSPSGAGKTTLTKLLSKNNNYSISVSHTTRKPRVNEVDSKDYYFVSENELLDSTKPLLNTDTLWKPHALLLLGDYFVFKKEYSKATEFYTQVLSLKNINERLYEQARTQLRFITNE